MKEPTHIRKGRTITRLAIPANEENGTAEQPAVTTDHKSINAAKRESRRIQSGGAVLRVNHG
jgi:hypothetical protein